MSRAGFLNKDWKRYPKVLSNREAFLFGRIKEISNGKVILKSESDFIECVAINKNCEDIEFGTSIDIELLVVGDVVAFDKKEKALFLLSPCLKKCNIKFESELRSWNQFLSQIETYFLEEKFFQARTPFLVESPGVDHHINYLQVIASETKRRWCLPTSPEIHLKKLLSSGFEKIFEIKPCFRDDLESNLHKVEFTMLEWYRSYVTLDSLVDDLEKLISKLFQDKIALKKVKLATRFFETTGFKLQPKTTIKELKALAHEFNIESPESDDWNDIFFRIYMEKVEPTLGKSEPEVLFDFPRQQASLAQVSKEGWAQRFELYWKGIELANAYCEVNDPEENQTRFIKEQALRIKSGKEASPVDEGFFESLKMGMPPSCGIALGLDRLYMLLEEKLSL